MSVTAANNPFRVERIHALEYQPRDWTWDQLLARCERVGYRGAVVGPHGSGKTTLVAALAERLRGRGVAVAALFANRDEGGGLPRSWRQTIERCGPGTVVIGDGYDGLNALARRWVRRHAARLIVTAHRRGVLRTLARTEARASVLGELVGRLGGGSMSEQEAGARLRACGGNMRAALRVLYDEAAALR